VREESHLEEMRAAIRGDRERAEQARRRSTENVLAPLAVPEPERAPEQPPYEPKRGLLSRLFGR
jgi:hypothetical protein